MLPSLLDRLTNDEQVHQRITEVEKAHKEIDRSLIELQRNEESLSQQELERKKKHLLDQRNELQTRLTLARGSIMSMEEIRDCVKRDLDWLLNSHQFVPQDDLDDYPEIKHSVLNYGLPDLAGKTVSGSDITQLEKLLKQAIIDFEPRIIKRSLKVRLNADESMTDHNALMFEIEGELWSQPVPLYLHLRTELQLDDGGARVMDFSA